MGTPSDRTPLAERVEELLAVGGPLPIVEAGDPVLRRVAEPFDGQLAPPLLARFVEALRLTMHVAPGVGLAAPQVGVGLEAAGGVVGQLGHRPLVSPDPSADDVPPFGSRSGKGAVRPR